MRKNQPSSLMSAPTDKHTWRWVLDSLRSSRAAEYPCEINVVDTILLDQGRPMAWLFTTRSGIVKRKTESRLTFQQIRKSFMRTSMNYTRNASGLQYAAVVHGPDSKGENLTFVEAGNLEQYFTKALPTTAFALQPFIEPKGDWEGAADSGRISNFRTIMSIDRTGRHSTQCFVLGAPTGFQDNKAQGVATFRGALVRSMNAAFNRPLVDQTMALVRTIEGVRRCRVRKMVSDFIVDPAGKPWFVNTIEIHTVNGKSKREAEKKTQQFVSIGNNGQITSSSSHNFPAVGNSSGTTDVTSSKSADERAMSPNTLKAYHRLSARKKREEDSLLHHARLSMSKPVKPKGGEQLTKTTTARTALGTSQSAGCPGDFCNFSIALNDQGARSSSSTSDGSETDRSGLSSTERNGVIARLRELTLNESSKHSTGESITNRHHGHGNKYSGSGNTNSYRVPYYWVPRARAERVLVTLMLRRYASGENGDYLSTLDNTHEMSDVLGANYPAHFYKDVDVCENCMKIYKLIDEARDSAMAKMERKMDGNSLEGRARERVWDEKPPPINERWASSVEISSQNNEISARAQGMARAEAAIACLTKSDISELRTFNNPPPAVVMVTRAVMLLITGDPNVTWKQAKKIMANGDRFFGMLSRVVRGVGDEKELPEARFLALQRFTDHPNFHPDCVEPVSSAAARFCAWVLGMTQAHGWATGTAHPRIDPLRPYSAPGEIEMPKGSYSMASLPPVHESASLLDSLTFAEKLVQERKQRAGNQKWSQRTLHEQKSDDFTVKEKDIRWGSTRDLSPPRAQSPERERRDANILLAFGRHTSMSLDSGKEDDNEQSLTDKTSIEDITNASQIEELSRRGRSLIREGLLSETKNKPKKEKLTRKQKRARAKIQARQMARLAGGGDEVKVNDSKGDGDPTSSKTDEGETFLCADGITSIPYEVMGTQELDGKNTNFIVLHDFFDTFESSQILFQRLVKRFVGCQVLVFNQPGQSDSRWKPLKPSAAEQMFMSKHSADGQQQQQQREPVLNNTTCADKLHELLQHLEESGEFVTSAKPFYLLGIGNGANIATAFSLRYGDTRDYGNNLRSLVLVNGFAHVDNQLAAVLHSSINVFSCFPETRPDLPISYFTRFLFSDSYLQKIDPNLVLNIYTAVANNITLGGRIAICKGALRHVDLRPRLPEIQVPIIIVQSTENVLVAPTNVDPYLEGRSVMHLWSHQHNGEGMNPRAHKQLQDTLMGESGRNAFVMWLNAGHEARQECKPAILDLLTRLASPESAIPEEVVQKQRNKIKLKESIPVPKRKGGKIGRKKRKKKKSENTKTEEVGGNEGEKSVEEKSEFLMAQTFTAGQAIESTEIEQPPLGSTAPANLGEEVKTNANTSLDQHPSVLERRRQARLQETQMEFEKAMKSHEKFSSLKSDKSQTERYTTHTKKDLGGVDVGVSSVPAAGLGLRTLQQEKEELEAKLASYQKKRLQKDQEDENELASMIANMKKEQISRAEKWKNDDQERLNKLESDLFERKKKRAMEDARRREELENLNTNIRLVTETKAETMLEEVKQSKIDAQVESAMSHVTVSCVNLNKETNEIRHQLSIFSLSHFFLIYVFSCYFFYNYILSGRRPRDFSRTCSCRSRESTQTI